MALTTIHQVPKGVVPYSQVTKIARLDSHTYTANLSETFRIGTVPNGGYTSSIVLHAAKIHLSASRGQKDFLTSHFEFLDRTEVGPVIIIIEDVKLGRQLSTIHATLYQGGLLPKAPWVSPGTSRKAVAAYLTMTDLSRAKGISLPTEYTLTPSPPPPTPNFSALDINSDQDPNWTLMALPPSFGRIQCLQNCVYYVPRQGQPRKSISDLWVRLSCGENITDSALGYIVDCWPYIVEAYRPAPQAESDKGLVPFRHDSVFWYPTVVMNIELKKSLGADGKRWVQMRVMSKQVRNGRLDLDIVILDGEGDIVALSQHTCLILGGERNTAGRQGVAKKGKL